MILFNLKFIIQNSNSPEYSILLSIWFHFNLILLVMAFGYF